MEHRAQHTHTTEGSKMSSKVLRHSITSILSLVVGVVGVLGYEGTTHRVTTTEGPQTGTEYKFPEGYSKLPDRMAASEISDATIKVELSSMRETIKTAAEAQHRVEAELAGMREAVRNWTESQRDLSRQIDMLVKLHMQNPPSGGAP